MSTQIQKNQFRQNIARTFKELKSSIIDNIVEDLEIEYKRHIEDICKEYRTLERNMDDLVLKITPVNGNSIRIVPAQFDPKEFMNEDLILAKQMQELELKLKAVVDRYQHRFGPVPDEAAVKRVLPEWVPVKFD